MLPSVTVTTNVENGRIIKDPIKRTEEIIVIAEVALPQRRVLVACEYDVVAALSVVTPVDHVKEKPRVFLVEFTMAYLVYDQTRRSYQTIQA